MSMRKVCLITFLFSLASLAAVAEEKHREQEFSKHKEEIQARLSKEIELLSKHKSCIDAAANMDAIRQCREKNREAQASLHQENKEMEKRRIEEQIQRLNERKEKLNHFDKR
ncbi:MAG: hypothetical protein HQK52_22515 [Oligoflexia bacterium]|nr:hypothetical protein [Oligoflexia bacterium]